MATNELMPYTSQVDMELDAMVNKPEIHYERRHGLDIHVYYLRTLGEISMALLLGDGEGRTCREFPVPNDSVNDAIAHPEIYADRAGLPRV